MTITLRTTKGSALTFREHDDNFREILDLRRTTIDQVAATGTPNALIANFTRAVVLRNGVMVKIKIGTQANTTAGPTLNVNSTGAKTITGLAGGPLGIGALVPGAVLLFSYDSGLDSWVAMNGGDALTFRGRDPDYYLDYDNFTGGPIRPEFLPNATTAARGVVRLATQAEVDAGTETEAVVTPATLASTTAGTGEIVAAGYWTASTAPVYLKNVGMSPVILRSGAGVYNVTFATPRPNANYVVTLGSGHSPISSPLTIIVTNKTTTGFQIQTFYLTGGSTRDHTDRDVNFMVLD